MRTRNIQPRPSVFDQTMEKKVRRRNKIGWEALLEEDDSSNLSDDLDSSSSSRSPEKHSTSQELEFSPLRSSTCASPNENVGKCSYVWCFAVVVGTLIILIGWLLYDSSEKVNISPNKGEELLENVQKLQDLFPAQNETLWESIYSGIETIVTDKPTKPSVFLLLHLDEKSTTECLAQNIAKYAVKFLDSPGPIVIRSKILKENASLLNDYGLFLSEKKPQLEVQRVMIVYELHDFPPEVAQSFHYLCDVDNPAVKEAAYIFTLKIHKNHPTRSYRYIAEDTLNTLWKKHLTTDIREALVARIANVVLFVNSENYLPC